MKEPEYLEQIEKFYTQDLFVEPKRKSAISELQDPQKFYQSLMHLAEKPAKRLHKYLIEFLENKSPENSSNTRKNLIISYWTYLEDLIATGVPIDEVYTKILLRYGILISSAISPLVLEKILFVDVYAPPRTTVFYLDEWLEGVGKGDISQSLLDNVKQISKDTLILNEKQKLNQTHTLHDNLIQKAIDISNECADLMTSITTISSQIESTIETNEFGYIRPIEEDQIDDLYKCIENIQSIKLKNKQLRDAHQNIEKYNVDIQSMQQSIEETSSNPDKEGSAGQDQITVKLLEEELASVRQMHKMSVGKTGNHIPVLLQKFFSGRLENFGTRERVLQTIQAIEKIDYTVFFRRIKQATIRMFPSVLLLPCYGIYGFCWEPFNFYNRNSSGAKLVIPMFSSNLFNSICYAIGDFRWQIGKEEARQRWTLEGITGRYYQWAEENKIRESLKEHFINSYVQWIQWESKGTAKLHKDIRTIFWKYIPFPNELKLELKGRTSIFRKLV